MKSESQTETVKARGGEAGLGHLGPSFKAQILTYLVSH